MAKHRDKILCVVVPTSLRQQVFKLCLDVKSARHLGIEKLLANLKSSAYWPNMSLECYDYVKSCSTCNINKKPYLVIDLKLPSYTFQNKKGKQTVTMIKSKLQKALFQLRSDRCVANYFFPMKSRVRLLMTP